MTIKEELVIDIPEIEEDFPGQQGEFRRQEIERAVIGFIYRLADKYTDSVAEDRLVRFSIGITLLQSFHREAMSDLTRIQIMMTPPKQGEKG